jgi:peroxiredoxin
MVEMPHIQKMYTELKDKGFEVISISSDDARSASLVKPLIQRNKYTFRVLLDKETTVVGQYNPSKVLPYTVVVDQAGKVAFVHQGYNPGDEVRMREEIEGLLGLKK